MGAQQAERVGAAPGDERVNARVEFPGRLPVGG